MECAHCNHEWHEHFEEEREVECRACQREGEEFPCNDFDH